MRHFLSSTVSQGEGTVQPISPFDPAADAKIFNDALKNSDYEALADLVTTRSCEQRRAIQKSSQEQLGVSSTGSFFSNATVRIGCAAPYFVNHLVVFHVSKQGVLLKNESVGKKNLLQSLK